MMCGDDGELTALEPVRRAILAWRSAAYDGEGIEQSADSKVKLTKLRPRFVAKGITVLAVMLSTPCPRVI